MNQLSFIIQFGFTFTIPFIILLKLLVPAKKIFINKWLLTCNWIVFLFLVIVAVENIVMFIDILSEVKTDSEGYNFYYSRLNLFSPYGWSFYLATFSPLVLILLFIWKNVRGTLLWSTAAIVLFHIEYIVIFITQFYRDYLPSSWSVYYDWFPGNEYIISFIIFNAAVLLVILANEIIWKKIKHA